MFTLPITCPRKFIDEKNVIFFAPLFGVSKKETNNKEAFFIELGYDKDFEGMENIKTVDYAYTQALTAFNWILVITVKGEQKNYHIVIFHPLTLDFKQALNVCLEKKCDIVVNFWKRSFTIKHDPTIFFVPPVYTLVRPFFPEDLFNVIAVTVRLCIEQNNAALKGRYNATQ